MGRCELQITERVDRLAYRLQLPPSWKIHQVVNVQYLEPAPTLESLDRELADPQPTHDDRFPDDTDRHDVTLFLDVRVRHLGRYPTPKKENLIQGNRRNG
ncbi:hypothetical protein N7472_000810 [Penicillium cf. griseofulvum]|uniref:Uncharacterized protein n=1 Tax=Penicillium cf. griseofulvum TaxID=2972120 RepID=A0A9W9MZW9_9EURO|nr:hypothetical protein N7472_000810 [Penicillium cf. griseofulvum]